MSSESIRQTIEQASENLKTGKNSEALKALDRELETSPDNADLYGLRGIAFAQMGRAEAATESFRKATMLAPSAGNFFNFAVHLHNIGDKAESLEMVEECLKLDPAHAPAKVLLENIAGKDPVVRFSAVGTPVEPTLLALKRRYGFGRKHLFAVLAENQSQWVKLGWAIVGLSVLSALLMIAFHPFIAPNQVNERDALGGLRPEKTPAAFAMVGFFITMGISSMIWTSLDLIDRRGRPLWMIPMMICCFSCTPFMPQALYMSIGRKDILT